ncbi:protein CHROMATIN REMODELING 5 isoform X1 [Cajanus cajan]|uniref:protein CHROMATIN REMODELING 5 isoform X1 n=1 Tax=Cajanus cajan TaxID=3821 RepID=UPI00098D9481|nr:protein CHROMATIN REMODELING 5 isoform X1 [Cajanus cajan]XP_020223025.1 protein CHROMATIN REMODELING 5 isoform X1 [Cajanus cajan]XP_020223026.1 protein CHROMATIN REMODELING 5 isoform X1 [Cajanus cajan]XP_020223027.1 protein CHROMATIN REMODELING 5 isoform X1 [Cajanus cajan]XP_020223028.1 protein CHROMATIN REMODELING 5 isoform X1 [Cajanus cajan]XP_029128583.1 protein CHROMATIN REMODELING 5 isoform X1 [Cajanus cajan]XP_029128584.1 protein CHROMATIN REMODELING 5 isoform X1 [Cajanus cajan]
MLSDEYYEQNDSMHYSGFRQPTGSNSRPQQMSTIVKRHMHKSRISDDAEDNDGDADYEEEDEADEDDPDDADFEPSTSNRATNKDKDWEGEDSDEAHNSDEEIDFSDNNDSYFDKKAKGRQRGKIGKSIRFSRDRKYTTSCRQRRVKSSFDDEDQRVYFTV